jgi:hypothetical protein
LTGALSDSPRWANAVVFPITIDASIGLGGRHRSATFRISKFSLFRWETMENLPKQRFFNTGKRF